MLLVNNAARKGYFYVYRWGTGFVDDKDYVDIWGHGRLLVSARRLGHGDGMTMIGTTDFKNIQLAINEKEKFRRKGNAIKRLPIFLGNMTYLGPNECDVDLECIAWLNECCDYPRTFASRGEMSEIVVQEKGSVILQGGCNIGGLAASYNKEF